MNSWAITIDEYCHLVPIHQAESFALLRKTILDHLPDWFVECLNYGMLGYVVPHSIYPVGYHCDPKLPLPFIGLAYQKNSINMYHMWLYADRVLMDWFISERPKHTSIKLDMGKSCIRFKNYEKISYELLEELVEKTSVQEWVSLYEESLKR